MNNIGLQKLKKKKKIVQSTRETGDIYMIQNFKLQLDPKPDSEICIHSKSYSNDKTIPIPGTWVIILAVAQKPDQKYLNKP